MANKRGEDQVFLGLQLKQDLMAAIDACRGFVDRSLWVRLAVADKLRAQGIQVPDELVYPPIRAGKGGPKVKVKSGGDSVFAIGDGAKVSISKKFSNDQPDVPKKRKKKQQ